MTTTKKAHSVEHNGSLNLFQHFKYILHSDLYSMEEPVPYRVNNVCQENQLCVPLNSYLTGECQNPSTYRASWALWLTLTERTSAEVVRDGVCNRTQNRETALSTSVSRLRKQSVKYMVPSLWLLSDNHSPSWGIRSRGLRHGKTGQHPFLFNTPETQDVMNLGN